MILPEKQKSKSRYTVTTVITMVLAFFMLSVLILANVPEAPENRELVRELRAFNVVNLLPEVEEPEPEPEELEEEMVEEELPPPPPPPPVEEEIVEEEIVEEVEVVERLDLGDLMPEGLQVDLSTEARSTDRPIASNTSASSGSGSQQRLRLDESVMGDVGGLNTLRDRKVGSRTAGRRTAASEDEKPSIDVDSGVEAEINTGIEAGINLSEGIQGRAAIADLMIAELIDLGDFMEDSGAMNTVYSSLSKWMGENPKPIPQSVNRIFTNGDQSSTHQTTTANFAVGERVFDLIIMNKVATNEIHVLLVEGTDATYLIDKNFSMQSNFLRRGSVTRQEDRIVEFGSSLRPANDEQTNEFYQIFLSWWNSVREDA